MQPEVYEPLAPGEEAMRIQIEVSEHLPHLGESGTRLLVLREFWRYAGEAGYQVTRGPEISVFHRPEYPGDLAFVVAVGVGRVQDPR